MTAGMAGRSAARTAAILGPLALALAAPVPAAAAREAIAIFQSWGAFRDGQDAALRCHAVSEPVPELSRGGGGGRAFVAVSDWPAGRIRRQLHVRLSHARRADARLTLSIGDSRFVLAGQGADGWAASRRADAEIVAAMRSGRSMSVETISDRGVPFADVYRLAGAASAIDAATLACLPG